MPQITQFTHFVHFTEAIKVLLKIPQIVNFFCLCDWERYAYKRGKRLFRFIKALQEIIYSSIDGPTSMFDERVRMLCSDFTGIIKSQIGNMGTSFILTHILTILGNVLIFKDVTRLVMASNTKISDIAEECNKRDITMLIFRGHVDGKWKQQFEQSDIERADWVVFPRVLRLLIKSSTARPREMNVCKMRYIPVIGIDKQGMCRDIEDTEFDNQWQEIIFCLVRDNPFNL
jgi:hypothetical protein